MKMVHDSLWPDK